MKSKPIKIEFCKKAYNNKCNRFLKIFKKIAIRT
jgi:hypothetical protein